MKISKHVRSWVQLFRSGATLAVHDFASITCHALLVLLVQPDHTFTCKMERKSGCEQGQETNLNHSVIENLVLSRFPFRSISVLELSPNSTVAGGNSHPSG